MERERQREDPAIGFTWGESEGERFIRNPDGDLRRISDKAAMLLEQLANGEIAVTDLKGTPRSLVEQLRAEGYLRPDDPVVRLDPPEDIVLWPRTLLFFGLFAVGIVAAWRQIPDFPPVTELYSSTRILAVFALSLLSLSIHEAGHYLAARPHLDPSIRIGRVNGLLPSAITDTTGAWILPQNRRRWITLAGPFVELVWLQLVIDVHYLLFPESVVLSLLVAVVVSHIVFSLNPLIHGDGYWLLMDTFDVVNLRKRGLEDLRERTPSMAAGYVAVSYGYGIVAFLGMIVSWAYVLGLL